VLLDDEGDTTCEEMSHMEMTGVLEELTARRRQVLSGEGFLFPTSGMVVQLCLTCNPRQLRNLVLWSGFIPLVSLYLILRNGRKYREQIEARKWAKLRQWPGDSADSWHGAFAPEEVGWQADEKETDGGG
jgi:hypothetical protein